MYVPNKCQLISRCPFGFFVWTKLPTKLFLDFCPEIFCSFLGASWKLLGASCGSHPVWPRDSFGPTLTSARKYFGPEYFGPEILWPETTSARRILRPAYILWPGNNFGPENSSARLYTSARKYFGPIDFGPLHFGPGTKLSKVSFFIIFDLP